METEMGVSCLQVEDHLEPLTSEEAWKCSPELERWWQLAYTLTLGFWYRAGPLH